MDWDKAGIHEEWGSRKGHSTSRREGGRTGGPGNFEGKGDGTWPKKCRLTHYRLGFFTGRGAGKGQPFFLWHLQFHLMISLLFLCVGFHITAFTEEEPMRSPDRMEQNHPNRMKEERALGLGILKQRLLIRIRIGFIEPMDLLAPTSENL